MVSFDVLNGFLQKLSDFQNLHSFPTRRSSDLEARGVVARRGAVGNAAVAAASRWRIAAGVRRAAARIHLERRAWRTAHGAWRSEEHTSELQSRLHLVCRLLLEKKKKRYKYLST